jgi:hypothetical protein
LEHPKHKFGNRITVGHEKGSTARKYRNKGSVCSLFLLVRAENHLPHVFVNIELTVAKKMQKLFRSTFADFIRKNVAGTFLCRRQL